MHVYTVVYISQLSLNGHIVLVPVIRLFSHFAVTGQSRPVPMVSVLEKVDCTHISIFFRMTQVSKEKCQQGLSLFSLFITHKASIFFLIILLFSEGEDGEFK